MLRKCIINKITYNEKEIENAGIDSMLCDSDTLLMKVDYDLLENGIATSNSIALKVVGEVNIKYDDENYRYASNMPDELIQAIKDNKVDEIAEIWSNNWIEVIGDNVEEIYGLDCLEDGNFVDSRTALERLISILKEMYEDTTVSYKADYTLEKIK